MLCKVVIPVLPVFKKDINLWLAELGFEKIENYCSFGRKNTEKNLQIMTVAHRPRTLMGHP